MPYELVKTDKLYYPDKPDKLNKPGKPNWLEKVKAVPLHTPWRECASMIIGTILYECHPFLHFSYCRFEEKAMYADYNTSKIQPKCESLLCIPENCN